MYLNKVQVAGNLTRDPELKALPSGMSVVNFSVATNRRWKDQDGKEQEAVEYHNCVMFGKRAEVISKYLSKGDPIYLEGRLQTRSWDKDGQKQYRTEVIATDFQFMGGKRDGDNSAPRNEQPRQNNDDDGGSQMPDYPEEDINPDDIPF